MSKKFKIAIDAFGGDHAPKSVVKGLNLYCKTYEPKDISFILFGDRKILDPMIRRYRHAKEYCTVYHTTDVVPGDVKPSQIIKKSMNTSLWQAIKFVRNGKADAILSAGNTGCVMAFAKLQLRTMEELKRPAITGMIPTTTPGKNIVMLDLGANTECSARSLEEFTIIGSLYYKVMNATRTAPTTGILNIGSEDTKGLATLQEANEVLRNSKTKLFKHKGFVEPDKILLNTVDVVVTDGFTGNIALKSIEGTAKLISHFIKEMFTESFFNKIMYLMLRRSMHRMKKKIDPNNYNGAVMAGLNGIVVKAHGGSNYRAFDNAIQYTVKLTKSNFNEKLKKALKEELGSAEDQEESAAK
ncbi:MAG: phosphate acyltransferase PlsX [Alphaproteobacteria bacterium]|jgi:glycerol-3-phosphate acyltransferase PlsX|nr:phosphate acyltransferase PlsX [Alphaproteobacteria bacterium]